MEWDVPFYNEKILFRKVRLRSKVVVPHYHDPLAFVVVAAFRQRVIAAKNVVTTQPAVRLRLPDTG